MGQALELRAITNRERITMLDTTLLVGVPLVASVLYSLFGTLMFLTALFLILLVLIQRGRGGGLSGAFGGAGGQSAFGTKAGDMFTRITMVTAAFWIGLCIAAILMLGEERSVFDDASVQAKESGRVIEDTTPVEGANNASPSTGEGAVSGGGEAGSGASAGSSEATPADSEGS